LVHSKYRVLECTQSGYLAKGRHKALAPHWFSYQLDFAESKCSLFTITTVRSLSESSMSCNS
jgi:hypothetical protein